MDSARARQLDDYIAALLAAARIPGAAIAIVAGGETVHAKGYGHRVLSPQLPANSHTLYPIASTSKAINATLLGMLVDDDLLSWDAPVQQYLPEFRLGDARTSAETTVRDLVIMRTGLPRHDWLWVGNPMSRPDLVQRLRHLELSAGFRERFQYNNLTVTTAGHIAERVTGREWCDLVRERLLQPLSMTSTCFASESMDNVTLAYHENAERRLVLTKGFETEVTAPSGGAIYSNVADMTRWLCFNLDGGRVGDRALIKPATLAQIHAPQIIASVEQGAPTAGASYAMGWFVDAYNGHPRLSHAGYLNDIHSEVMIFPQHRIGTVCFTNFGPPGLSRLINQYAFDLLTNQTPSQTVEEKLAEYERKITAVQERTASARRVPNTTPSHALDAYAGRYTHPAYGDMDISATADALTLHRNTLSLPLEHWHYDAWIAKDIGRFVIHVPHVFNAASRLLFETNPDGEIAALLIPFEPAVAPIRFAKSGFR